MPTLTDQQLHAAARARISTAMERVERAQGELSNACAELSAIHGGVPVWRKAHKLHDQVKSFWYKLDAFRAGGKWKLDDDNVAALQRRAQAAGE